MFTGIIEALGKVVHIEADGTNLVFEVQSPISHELKIDQSLAHNGVCLTVIRVDNGSHWVTAVEETLTKSNLGLLKTGNQVNLERAMLNNGRFDGHIVQGHVDQVGLIKRIQEGQGSWIFDFQYAPSAENITVEKGSITVNGISLTCFNSKQDGFSVAIIPYTFENTNLGSLSVGDSVNLEFDIIGKYVRRMLSVK